MNKLIPSLDHLSNSELVAIADSLDAFLFKQVNLGEPYAKTYRKDMKNFKRLVNATVELKRSFQRYFKSQVTRLPYLVSLHKIHADDSDEDVYMDDAYWDEDTKQFVAHIYIDLEKIFSIGSASTVFKTQTTVDPTTLPAAKFLRNYSFDLVTGINDTTKERLREQIKTSIQLGETRDQLTSRLTKVIDNPVRARMIAQTESVRAYSEGRFQTLKEMGAKTKTWVGPQATDTICGEVDGETVPINEPFSNGEMYPPAHPNCQCGFESTGGFD